METGEDEKGTAAEDFDEEKAALLRSEEDDDDDHHHHHHGPVNYSTTLKFKVRLRSPKAHMILGLGTGDRPLRSPLRARKHSRSPLMC